MARPLREIEELQKSLGNPPIFYVGDIFDYWKSSPEVINFAIKHIPAGYSIPGQHDLPDHSYAERERSAYWTLVLAGALTDIASSGPKWFNTKTDGAFYVSAFPWGSEIKPAEDMNGVFQVALIHKFIWTEGCGYEQAPVGNRVEGYTKALKGYDMAVFGDNHKGFIVESKGQIIVNCGGMMRRRSDEHSYAPSVALLDYQGEVYKYYLDVSADSFAELTEEELAVEELLQDMADVVDGLRDIASYEDVDFVEALGRYMEANEIEKDVVDIVIKHSSRNKRG